jgi:hypothetical protein
MRSNLIISADSVVEHAKQVQKEIDGQWVQCRPEGYSSFFYRVKAAWLVFTGKADALTWPKGQ